MNRSFDLGVARGATHDLIAERLGVCSRAEARTPAPVFRNDPRARLAVARV